MWSANKQKIRNLNGKLICELSYDGFQWQVIIKNHDCYTILQLEPNGSSKLTNHLQYK